MRAPRDVASVARMSTPIDLGRPVAGDVIDLILEDHRRFEALLRDLRDSSSDRDAVRRALAALHVAGRAPTLVEGVARAAEAIDSSAAGRLLDRWAQLSQTD